MRYKKYIEEWGIPPKLKECFPNREFIYRTEGECSYYNNHKLDIKETLTFELFDVTANKAVIYLDCFVPSEYHIEMQNCEVYFRLQTIHIPSNDYRRLGVARFCIHRTIETMMELGVFEMRVKANPITPMFEEFKLSCSPGKKDLISFYKSFETDLFNVVCT